MELDRFPRGRLHLVVNRVRSKLLRSMHATIDDAIDTAGLPLLGVVPEDENIVISTNQGEPLVGKDCQAGQAYMNICHRILGEEVPYLNLEATNGLFQKLKAIFKK